MSDTANPPDRDRSGPAPTNRKIGIAHLDQGGRLLNATPSFLSLLDLTPVHLGSELTDWMQPLGVAWAEDLAEALQSPGGLSLPTLEVGQPSGVGPRLVDLELLRLPTGPDGTEERLLLALDVTAQHRLQGFTELFRQAFLVAPHPEIVLNGESQILTVNPAFEDFFGYTRADVQGKPFSFLTSNEAGILPGSTGVGEVLARTRSGEVKDVSVTISSLRDFEGRTTHMVLAFADQTERRLLERQRLHQQRLAALGEMAAGVAHELNAPLANAGLAAAAILRKTNDTEALQKAQVISDQIETSKRIIRGLLDMARVGAVRSEEMDVAEVVRGAVGFVRGKRTEDVEVVETYPDMPVMTRGDRVQVTQVVTNLLANAYDALGPEGGTVRVSVALEKDTLVIDVADDGPGIPPEVLTHLFQPFFTTKGGGKGTGLGLAISQGIIQSHSGSLTVDSALGSGTCFHVRLPWHARAGKPGPLPT